MREEKQDNYSIMETKFNIIECGISDESDILTSKDLSELTGGCFIDLCGVKACGAQVNIYDEEQHHESYFAF
jgi:hypothetical protein